MTDLVAANTIPIWKKYNLTPKEAAEYSHIGLNKLDELLNDPMCSFVLHIGKKRLIKRKEFEKFLESRLEI
ncbi:MAG: helix-turn-helix domain-containing protein [Clostridia bacterium]|nr:helix-turn-helix domain-containing protein [Clostridia bacterium]